MSDTQATEELRDLLGSADRYAAPNWPNKRIEQDGLRWVPQAEADWLRQRLETAVDALRLIARNYDAGATFSGTQCRDIARDALNQLGEWPQE